MTIVAKIEQPPVVPAGDTATQMVSVIERMASNPSVDVDKLERLLQMQERVLLRNAEASFNAAMSAAQSEMGRISTDATNPSTKSKYASYGQLDRTLRPIYTAHGFALSFGVGETPIAEHILVLCNVSHQAGFSRQYSIPMPADGKGAKGGDVMTKTHATGAAVTYGMRYLLKMIFNVAIGEDDNDGNAAAKSAEKITTDQAIELRDLIKETGSTERGFLDLVQAESIESIPASAYKTCHGILAAKLKRVRS